MLKYWIWMAELPGLTNQVRLALLRHFGTPENAFYADAGEILLTEGITREQAEALDSKSLAAAGKILEDCRRLGLRVLTFQDAEYPNRLRNIYAPPFLLYVRGRLPAIDEEPVITVVGTRKCTPYGEACGEKLGYGLARGGAVVVSGLARGVDAAARGYAQTHGVSLTEFLPDYARYGRAAPLRRNVQIVAYADLVLAFWDGKSRGTKFVIDQCKKMGVPVKVFC